MISSRRSILLPALLIVIAVFLTHGAALRFGYVNYDDPTVIVENKAVLGPTFENMKAVFGEVRDYAYLPIYYASFWIDTALFGKDPRGAHAISLLWHALNAVLGFLLLRKVFPAGPIAFVGALLHAIHPVTVESAVWISGRKDLVSYAFMLGSLLAAISGIERKSARSALLLSPLLLLIGLFAKATVLVQPLCLGLVLCLYRKDDRLDEEAARLGRRSLILSTLVMAFATAVHFAVARSEGTADVSTEGLGARALGMIEVFGRYVLNFVAPFGLSLHYDKVFDGAFTQATVHGLLAVAATAAVLAFCRRRNPALFFGVAWFVLSLAPVNNLLPRFSIAMADRYLYVGVLGLGAAVGALPALVERVRGRTWSLVAIAILALFFGWIARSRTNVWSSSESLWRDAVAKSPKAALPRLQLGHALEERALLAEGDRLAAYVDEARTRYEEARGLARTPVEAMQALMKLGGVLVRLGRFGEALPVFTQIDLNLATIGRGIERRDKDTLAITHATALAGVGDWAGARARAASVGLDSPVAKEAKNLEASLDYLEAWQILEKKGAAARAEWRPLIERALAAFEKNAERWPDDKKSRVDYLRALLAADWVPDHIIRATNEVSKLVRRFPDDPTARALRSEVFAEVDPVQAVADLDFALKRDPYREEWYERLSGLLRKAGRNKEALLVLQTGWRRLPTSRLLKAALVDFYSAQAAHQAVSGNHAAVLEFAERAVSVDPLDAAAEILAAEAHEGLAGTDGMAKAEAQKHWEAARLAFEKAYLASPGDARARLGLARSFKRQGYGYAYEATRPRPDLDPAEALTLRRDLRRLQHEAFLEALKLAPGDESIKILKDLLPQYAKDLYEEAATEADAFRYAEAKKLLVEGLRYDPANVDLLGLLGSVESTLGNRAAAKAAYAGALSFDPDDLRSLYESGVLAAEEKEWRLARERFERFAVVAKLAPDAAGLEKQIAAAERLAKHAADEEKARKKDEE